MKKKLFFTLSLFALFAFTGFAQKTVSGTVTDASGEVMIGVNILEVGTSNGTITDLDGNFSIEVSDDATLEFSMVGYTPQQIEVGSQTVIDLVLEEGVALSEVVVTSLGISKEKKALGYAVTEIGGEDFTEARELNVANSLAGKVAGVNVSNIASGPGGSSRVIIRGNSSISGNNQPLYVVDGIPIDNTNLGSAGMWGGQDWGDGVSSINPDDIETMTVLKGSSAAALYGSRASNGVIMITTKKGGKRKGVGVEVQSNYTFENIIETFDFQKEYGQGDNGKRPTTQPEAIASNLYSWGEKLDGRSTIQFDGQSRPYSDVGDNLGSFYQTGSTWTNSLSLSGGDENYNFRFGVTNLENQGIIPNSGLDRNTFTTNTSGKFGKLTASFAGTYIRENVQNRPRLSDSPGNANYTAWSMPANVDVNSLLGPNGDGTNEEGTELLFNDNIYVTNPWFAAYNFVGSNTKHRAMGNTTLRFQFTDWLYIQGRAGIDSYTERRTSLEPYGTAYKPLGGMSELERRFTETNLDLIIGVDKTLDNGIGISAFVGGNQMERSFETLGGGGDNFNIPFLHTLNNLANRGTSYGISEKAINSVFGSLELSYNSILYLTATARNDWFSTLPVESNSILYPSFTASFILSDAITMPSFVSFAKLRGGWAQVGGDTDPYQLNLTYALVGQGHFGAPLGRISQGTIPNFSLQPSQTSEIELGADFRLFQNKLGVDITYYDKTTSNDILFASISQTSGFGSQVVNIGELRNSGIELLLNITPIKRTNFSWDMTFNFANNQNEVVSLLTPEQDEESIRVSESRTRSAYIHHEEGQPYSVIKGFKYARDAAGNIQYDENGYPVRGEFGVLGNGVHPTTLGLTNRFRYKNFQLSVLVDGKFGGDIYAATNAFAYLRGLHKNTLVGRENGNVGGPKTLPLDEVDNYYSQIYNITEEFVEDASFIKLRQFTLGYNFPKTMLESTPFSEVSLSLVGRNLLLLMSRVDNIDPESTYSNGNDQGLEMFGVPQTRSFGFNLNVKF
ncbi:MAG: SusC/RagA family TonB-linked outer membrane protein [Saprospiraceae bacterium]